MSTVRLQSLGTFEGTPAGQLQVNDTMVWNFGHKSTVVEIVKETAKSIIVKTRSEESGDFFEQRFLKTRNVVILPR